MSHVSSGALGARSKERHRVEPRQLWPYLQSFSRATPSTSLGIDHSVSLVRRSTEFGAPKSEPIAVIKPDEAPTSIVTDLPAMMVTPERPDVRRIAMIVAAVVVVGVETVAVVVVVAAECVTQISVESALVVAVVVSATIERIFVEI
jgi:hypothetical protein